jgi:hypothetical protein
MPGHISERNIKLKYLHGVKYSGFGTTKRWMVAESFTETLSDGITLTIPAGFKTDLSTVPRILWPLFAPYGDFIRAAIVHDWMYVTDYKRAKFGTYRARKLADDEMLYLSSCYNPKNPIDNYLRWAAVRIFGRFIYLK